MSLMQMATHQCAHQRISLAITTMTRSVKVVAEAIERGKHAISKKDKNSYIGYYRVRIKTDALEDKTRNTTKSVVSLKKENIKT